MNPSFVVADEPTSMLDVSIRTGIMQLMDELADRLGISYLYITHDLAVARYMCSRIAVMYLGKIVEMGETRTGPAGPRAPVHEGPPVGGPRSRPAGQQVPYRSRSGAPSPCRSTRRPRSTCRFYDRCPIADDFCRDNDHPPLEDKGGGRLAACYKA